MNTPRANASFSAKQQAVIEDMAKADADDVKKIAVKQLEMLADYYELSLSHANRSFRVALVAGAIGLGFFLWAAWSYWGGSSNGDAASLGMMGGAVSEFIAGVNFLLYGKTLEQLNLFQGKLENTQRFLLANSLCESLKQENLKEYTRARLIGSLVGMTGDESMRDMVAHHGQAGGQIDAVMPTMPSLPMEEVAATDGVNPDANPAGMAAMRPL